MPTDDGETEFEDNLRSHHPVSVDQSNSNPSRDSLLRRLRSILYPFPSGLLVPTLWLVGVALAVIWNRFHPAQYSGDRAEGLTIFFVVFFVGLGFLVYAIKGESMPGRLSNPLVAAVLLLGLSLFFLYVFIVGK